MERVKIADGTTWPDPSGEDYNALAWRLIHAPESVEKSCMMEAAAVMEAYAIMVQHPAFTLKKVQEKISGIRQAIKDKKK